MPVLLYSAPNPEYYSDHIFKCKEKFEIIFPVFVFAIRRVFNTSLDEDRLKECFEKMILFHDLGKLTKKWQERLKTNKKLPPHATLGAVYIWKVLREDIRHPLSFAIAIHHSDRGLLGDNIERPDVQAIINGIADSRGRIVWDEKVNDLNTDLFPRDVETITVNDLKEMARGLRVWAKGCGLLDQHQRRIQASLAHHILKLCDIAAATERERNQTSQANKAGDGGWLMVNQINNYVNQIKQRGG